MVKNYLKLVFLADITKQVNSWNSSITIKNCPIFSLRIKVTIEYKVALTLFSCMSLHVHITCIFQKLKHGLDTLFGVQNAIIIFMYDRYYIHYNITVSTTYIFLICFILDSRGQNIITVIQQTVLFKMFHSSA